MTGDLGNLLPLGYLHEAIYDNIICGTCGHTEWFVSKDSLYRVKEKFKPVD
jgi:hypothetical protein